MPKLPSTYHPAVTTSTPIRGELVPGVDCYIIGPAADDHRVSKRGVLTALTLVAKHAKSDRYIERIPAQILAEVGLDPMGPNLVPVSLPDQPTAHTYSATDFVRILSAYAKWLASGTMRKDQEHLGRNAAGVLATFAALGVVAAIRNACGVDEARPQTVTLDPESRALIANLEARVTALEARPTAPTLPTDKAKTYFDRLRADNEAKNPAVALRKLLASGVEGRPAHHLSKERYIAFDPAEVEAVVGRAGVVAWASSGWLVKDSKHHVAVPAYAGVNRNPTHR